MRNGPLYIIVSAVVVLGLAIAVTAALGSVSWAIALGGIGLALLALLLLFVDRRSQASVLQTRQSADRARQSANRVAADVRRVESLVDSMQRRLVASLESARVEAATRHRDSASS